LYRFRVIASYLSKVAYPTYICHPIWGDPVQIMTPPFGVTPFKFRQYLWIRKLEYLSYPCGIACMILCLVVFDTIPKCDGCAAG